MRKGFELIARAVIVRGGKVLMTSAKGDKRRFLPGGHIEFGERAEDALRRELNEELGAKAKIGKLIGVTEKFVHTERQASARAKPRFCGNYPAR